MIEQIAKVLFEKGAAERVIACVMSKDRAHMHLDTIFTMLDRDVVTMYPKVVDQIRAISLRPGGQGFHVTEEKSFLSAIPWAPPRLGTYSSGAPRGINGSCSTPARITRRSCSSRSSC
jgi:N-dimethylarginine dimethylaminohydrolase